NGQDCSVDGVGIDERLITLDVHNDLCAFGAGDFRDAIRARNVIFACHSDACPKRASRVKYTWVVGGNDRAEKIPCLGGPFVNVLQHGLASQRGQNFAGETGGRESGRDDAEKFTRHTRGYHKTPMLHSGKKGWPANMRQSYRKLLIVSGIGLWGCALWGQATIETRPRPGLKAEPRQQANIRLDTNLVLIPVTVTDPMNRFVTGLEKENFKLFEDKQPQEITQFSSEDAPISVGVVFDCSGSMGNKLEKSRQAVAQFFKLANPEDEFFLV